VEESLAGISRKDFIAKMSIASKEARETRYWILLLERSELLKYDYQDLKRNINEIIGLLTAIVKTSQSNLTVK
jgi:four helix bundle protein